MAAFDYVWGPGGLANNQPAGAANLSQLDKNVTKCVNGDEGGAWSPEPDPIMIGGTKGLWVGAPFRADDATVFTVKTGGIVTFNAGSTATINGTFTFTGASTPIFLGLVTLANTGTLNAAAGSTCTLAGTTSVPSGGVFSTTGTGALNLGGVTTQQGVFAKSGSDALVVDRVAEIDKTEPAVTLSTEADFWFVQSPTSAGTTVYTLKSTSPVPPEGVALEVAAYNITVGKTIELQREGGTTIATFGTGYGAARLRFLGGAWRLAFISGDSATIGSA